MSEFGSNKKRQADEYKTKESTIADPETEEALEFEDPFEDEFEQEEFQDDGELDDEEDEREEQLEEVVEDKATKQTWRPGIDKLPDGEILEYDPSAYVMYHSLKTEWPCLSFDIVKDNLGDNRHRFPLSMYAVIGSQADSAAKNKITLLKISDLTKIHKDDSDEGMYMMCSVYVRHVLTPRLSCV